jgi:hypothetical protein
MVRRLTAESAPWGFPLYFPLRKLRAIQHVITLSVLVIYCCVETAGRVMVQSHLLKILQRSHRNSGSITERSGNMRLAQAILCVLVVFLGWAARAATTESQQGDSSDELAIRALLDKVNLACNADSADKGAEILGSVISDKSYVTLLPRADRPSEALVGDKKLLCEVLAQSLRNGQKWGVHEIRQITIVGPIAYEIGENRRPNQDPKTPVNTWLNVFAKEDVGWRLVFSTPADSVQKALRRFEAREGKSAK